MTVQPTKRRGRPPAATTEQKPELKELPDIFTTFPMYSDDIFTMNPGHVDQLPILDEE